MGQFKSHEECVAWCSIPCKCWYCVEDCDWRKDLGSTEFMTIHGTDMDMTSDLQMWVNTDDPGNHTLEAGIVDFVNGYQPCLKVKINYCPMCGRKL